MSRRNEHWLPSRRQPEETKRRRALKLQTSSLTLIAAAVQILKETFIMMMLSLIGATSLWFVMVWAALILFFSPVLFVVSVCLPELPLLLIRRLHYIPFDSV